MKLFNLWKGIKTDKLENLKNLQTAVSGAMEMAMERYSSKLVQLLTVKMSRSLDIKNKTEASPLFEKNEPQTSADSDSVTKEGERLDTKSVPQKQSSHDSISGQRITGEPNAEEMKEDDMCSLNNFPTEEVKSEVVSKAQKSVEDAS